MFALSIEACQYTDMASPKIVPCCSPVLQARLDKTEAEELAATFRALADPGRLRLLSFIAAQPGAEACVCHLTGPIGLSQPTVSHHLKVLNDAGLVEREKRGTWVYYRISPPRLEAVRAALAPSPPRRRVARRS
jgi:ArsR family transcriptional regulator, arsenate/arsenite/antimonite-responsive transcriptional repressor